MSDFSCVIVIAHGSKIGPRTMRTKLNNNNTHNAETHMEGKSGGKLHCFASLKPPLVRQTFQEA